MFIRILLGLALHLGVSSAADRPNLLVFLVDDMGLMDSSVPFLTDGKGKPEPHPLNAFYRTPSLERLARNGIRFETFYANSVCSPTRVSLMTGQSSARHRTTQWIRPNANNHGPLGPRDWNWQGIGKEHQTLPGLLQKAGYRTIHAGKAHFGPEGSYGERPDRFGFDVNIAGGAMGQPGSYYGTDHFGWKNSRSSKTHAVPGLEAYHGQDIYLTEVLTREMNGAIDQAVTDRQPFFAYMAYYAVHAPFQPNRKYLEHYKDAPYPKAAQAFATMIESMDTSVGHVLDHLDTLGVSEDTLVLFLGDNGSDAPMGPSHDVASSAPLRGKKGTHYEGGMRVPFIAGWAKPDESNPLQQRLPVASGALSREMADITDLMPTLLAAAGVEAPDPIDGDNLGPALNGGKLQREREWLMHFPHNHRSSYFTVYRLGGWKLIYHYTRPAGKRCELFNLAADRTEQHNLADSEPEVRKRMIAAMSRALEDADAQYPRAAKDSSEILKPVVE
jgi:arylsulfatase A-like enzyme